MRKIASGGMASVYLGRTVFPKNFHRVVAVKLCHPHLSEDPKFAKMLLHEAQLAARIRHTNVVQTLDVGVEGELYLVMDYVDGASLAELVRRANEQDKPLPISVVAAVLMDTLEGLEAAHTAVDENGVPLGVIHRDISPQNLLVGRDGITRVADFGVAKAALDNPVTTKTGEVKGKLSYISPEQLSTTDAVTPKADIFAVGIVAWELIEGERLFTGDTYADTVQRVLYVPIPPLESQRALAYPAFVESIERALLRDPDERAGSAKELRSLIEQSGVPIASRTEVSAYVEDLLGPPSLLADEVLATAIVEDARLAKTARTRRLALLGAVLGILLAGAYFGFSTVGNRAEGIAQPNNGTEAQIGSIAELPPDMVFEEVSIDPLPQTEPDAAQGVVDAETDAGEEAPSETGAARTKSRSNAGRERRRGNRSRRARDKKKRGSALYDPETI